MRLALALILSASAHASNAMRAGICELRLTFEQALGIDEPPITFVSDFDEVLHASLPHVSSGARLRLIARALTLADEWERQPRTAPAVRRTLEDLTEDLIRATKRETSRRDR